MGNKKKLERSAAAFALVAHRFFAPGERPLNFK